MQPGVRGDFPFYAGHPVPLSPLQWLDLMACVCLAAIPLLLPLPFLEHGWGAILPSLLLLVVPLVALRRLVGPHWRALLRPLRWTDLALAAGTAVLSLIATAAVALVLRRFHELDPNAVGEILRRADAGEVSLFLLRTIPQIAGEEVITVLPFLALLAGLSQGLRLPRHSAVAGAWLLSALPFALFHLPAYGGNLLQCLLVIGTARLVVMLAYLKTRNLLVSSLAHLLHDWIAFGGVLLLRWTAPDAQA
ncbi:MAG: CPBP family intramembrane metalloprotease [Aquabacterium sp.]|jgi:membrane protease YdiL (CAAX protease family)|nr:MAG: CPBP family intramembrane metalloprotease [Aquabacterium sp.]